MAASAPVNTIVEKAEEEEEESLFITSPIVGTFYSAAAPDVPAFVKVGDQVKSRTDSVYSGSYEAYE